MGARFVPFFAVFALACGGSGSSSAPDDVLDARADEGQVDFGELDFPRLDEASPDKRIEVIETMAEQALKTCESVLMPWHCLASVGVDCPPYAECLGQGTCETPPCFGLCQDYPGQCVPRLSKKVCTKSTDCGPGEACASKTSLGHGLCRARPFEGACWLDENCPAGQKCAGEVVCKPGKYCVDTEHPGQCVTPPGAGSCFEDSDCGSGLFCDGATLCGGKQGCTLTPGTCKGPARPDSCYSNDDCPKEKPWCAGAFKCPTGTSCPAPDQPGFCVPPPMADGCWGEDDCSASTPVCRALSVCPPGTLCHADSHRGYCSELPPDGERGLTLDVPDSATVQQKLLVPILVKGSLAAYVDACYGVTLQWFDKVESKWRDYIPVALADCSSGGPGRIRIPPGNGVVLEVTPDFSGIFRLNLFYDLLCSQVNPKASCQEMGLTVNSKEFVVKPAR